ncbi:hypothetical protein [Paenibacillus sp. JJ-223]|uniref:hypothetical protein n=1 Tax=Paenibacillus sp. JJ-223 TaxID=2905647 RepID=UPI001F26D7AC|nr:hypothetical protein [Paenibacillus sp. JJ-223]
MTLGVACFPSVFRSIKAAGKVIVSTEIGGMPIAEIGISATESWNILANGCKRNNGCTRSYRAAKDISKDLVAIASGNGEAIAMFFCGYFYFFVRHMCTINKKR